MILRTETIQVKVTPKELASEFCEMDSMQQAEFFNTVASISKEWECGHFIHQMNCVSSEQMLTDSGHKVMSIIGDCAAPF